MKRDLICLIKEDTLVSFTTRVPLANQIGKEILNTTDDKDITQILVNNSVGYSKTMYSGMSHKGMNIFSVMSHMNENIHERNIYIINDSDMGAKCEFAEKYMESTDKGIIISPNHVSGAENLTIYCRAKSTKKYYLAVRLFEESPRLEYKLAI